MKKMLFLMIVIMAGVAMAEDASPAGKYNVAHSASEYDIGDNGPAGGTIFYDKGNNDGGWQYLEAAPEDLPGGNAYYWSIHGLEFLDTSTAIGSGMENTKKIVLKQGYSKDSRCKYAAHACYDYAVNGYDDWFLPSKDELNELCKQKDLIDGIVLTGKPWYWTSSERDTTDIWLQYFYYGTQGMHGASEKHKVRPVRAF